MIGDVDLNSVTSKYSLLLTTSLNSSVHSIYCVQIMPAIGIGNELFKHAVNALLTLLKAEYARKELTISQFLDESGISRPVFFNHLKRNLELAGLVEFKVNPDRTVTMYLTERGRKLARALGSVEEILKEIGVI